MLLSMTCADCIIIRNGFDLKMNCNFYINSILLLMADDEKYDKEYNNIHK